MKGSLKVWRLQLLKPENISVRVACLLPLQADGLDAAAEEDVLGREEVFAADAFGALELVFLDVEELLLSCAWRVRRSG